MQNKPGPLYAGILAGLSGHIALDTKPSEGSITVSLEQPDPVFPLFAGMYRENGIGTLSIMNNESAEIRIVTVNFTAGNYSASLMNCGTVEVLRKRKSVDIPLYADFAPSILNFTEDGKMPGKILVSYELLGSSRTISVPVVVCVFNRNSIRWTDASALAAYVSPNAPEVLDLSKYLLGELGVVRVEIGENGLFVRGINQFCRRREEVLTVVAVGCKGDAVVGLFAFVQEFPDVLGI
jgi:hypothetical protein